jgi:hypothetical protein
MASASVHQLFGKSVRIDELSLIEHAWLKQIPIVLVLDRRLGPDPSHANEI